MLKNKQKYLIDLIEIFSDLTTLPFCEEFSRCPLSMLLYIIATELLANIIDKD